MDFDVKNYEFQSFSGSQLKDGEVSDFEFSDLEGKTIEQIERHQQVIKSERKIARTSNFNISPIVRHHRGIQDQEEAETERRIQDEVERRVAAIQEQAYADGYDKGVQIGREEVYEQTIKQTEEKLETLSAIINDVLVSQEDILQNQKLQIYSLVKTLSKWVILKELEDDGQYIERLLEKLILEMQTKKNLLIRVDQKDFEQMPEVLEHVQKRLGELVNVRVETDYDIEGPGIVLESENGIINGTIEEQFKSLSKLFESVGVIEDANE